MITTIKNLFRKPEFGEDRAALESSWRRAVEIPSGQPFSEVEGGGEPVFRLHAWLELRKDGETRILVDNQSGSITSCNPTAWTILEALSHGATPSALASRIVDAFDIGQEQAEADVDGFFRHLMALGYVEEAG